MLMPEASMHEDCDPVAWKHDVGASRQITPMKPKPVSEPMKRAAHGQLRQRVPLAYAGHHRATFRIYQETFRHPEPLAKAYCNMLESCPPFGPNSPSESKAPRSGRGQVEPSGSTRWRGP